MNSTPYLKAHHCDCEKYKFLVRPSDLANTEAAWIRDLVVPCGHKPSKQCNCDLVISIPYGYFFPVRRSLEIGDTIGPTSTYVRIVSSDDFEFVIKRRWMKNSLVIDSWFKNDQQTPPGEEAEVIIRKYPSLCVYYLCTFLMYKHDYETGTSLQSNEFTVPDTLVFQMLEMAHDFIV